MSRPEGPGTSLPEGPGMDRPEGASAEPRDQLDAERRDQLDAERRDQPDVAVPERPLAAEAPEDPFEAEAQEPAAREREALRLQRANRATRGGLAALLCLEAFVALLVPRGIAQTPEGISTTKTVLLIGLALVLIACAFLLTRPWGIALGSILQLALAATVLLVPALAVVVVIFLLLWLYLLRTRRIWLGTRRGWRMLVS